MELSQVKHCMKNKTLVTYDGVNYTITGCILRYRSNAFMYSLELHSLKANSVLTVDITKVEIAQ